jgi:hypothetical protein
VWAWIDKFVPVDRKVEVQELGKIKVAKTKEEAPQGSSSSSGSLTDGTPVLGLLRYYNEVAGKDSCRGPDEYGIGYRRLLLRTRRWI